MTTHNEEMENGVELMIPGERPVEARPRKREILRSPVVFMSLLVLWSIIKATAGGYTSGSITSIEKRFQLKSTEIGYIATVEDIVGLTTLMLIVHFGQSQHRPRVIGLMALLVAAGVLTQSLPHFLYRLPLDLRKNSASMYADTNATDTGGSSNGFCAVGADGGTDNQVCTEEEEASAGSLFREAFWIPFGSAIASLGGGIGPIAITYLDDNVPKRTMPIYAAILFSVYAFGSIFGFVLASFCLQLPVTFPFDDPEYYSARPGDANWLGAWWLGYVICSILLAVLGSLFCLFPRRMRDPDELAIENAEYNKNNPIPEAARAKEKKIQDEQNDCSSGVVAFIKDFLVSLMYILRNVVIICLTLAGCLAAFSATAFMIFGPKFLSVVYELDPSKSAMVMGGFLIPGAFLGQIFGGIVIKKLKLNRYGMAVMAVITDLFLVVGIVLFYMIRCDQRGVAGLNVPYQPEMDYSALMPLNATSPPMMRPDGLVNACNEQCGCPEGVYQPVCGNDMITYVTPCHAGCSVYDSESEMFSECTCISDSGMAALGQCERPCSAWLFYILLMIPSSFLGTMGGIAGFMLQLRSVDESHRGLAMSFGNVMIKILGYIPGPVIVGAVIETACLMFQKRCGKTGNCLVYNSDWFLNGFNTTMIVASIISSAFVVLACLKVRAETPKDERAFRNIPENDDVGDVEKA